MNARSLLSSTLRISVVLVASAVIASCSSSSGGATRSSAPESTQHHGSGTTTTSPPKGVEPALTGTLLLSGGSVITPLDLATSQLGRAIQTPGFTRDIALLSGQGVAYTSAGTALTEIDLRTGTAGRNIQFPVRSTEGAPVFLVTPDGSTAWVLGRSGVFPVDLKTGQIGPETEIGTGIAIAISHNGQELWVAVSHDLNASTPSAGQVFSYSLVGLNARTGRVESSIDVPNVIFGMALSEVSDVAYLLEVPATIKTPTEILVPVNLDTGQSGQPVLLGNVASSPELQSIVVSRDSSFAYVLNQFYGTPNGAGLLERVDLQSGTVEQISPPISGSITDSAGAWAVIWDGASTLLVASGSHLFSLNTNTGTFSREYEIGDLSVAAMVIWPESSSSTYPDD